MLIDTHSHVHFTAFKEDMDEVVRASLAKDINLIAVGTRRDTSEAAVRLAERFEGVWAAVGLHPTHLFPSHHDEQEVGAPPQPEIFDAEVYRALARRPKTLAIGEIGLDYFHDVAGIALDEIKRRQAEMFMQAAKLAIEEGLPVIIHCRDAHDDMAGLIETVWGPYKTGEAPRGVIHCFTGSWRDAERYFALGFFISFTGVITYPPKKADIAAGKELLIDVVKRAPLDKILVETDSPYLAPVPMRGKRNLPEYVDHVARKVAELKGIPFEEVAAATTANAKVLFRKLR